jgi:hypothetical protein
MIPKPRSFSPTPQASQILAWASPQATPGALEVAIAKVIAQDDYKIGPFVTPGQREMEVDAEKHQCESG